MPFNTETDKITTLLDDIASCGFLSQPVQSEFSWAGKQQKCIFNEEAIASIRTYMAKYHSVLSRIDYPAGAFSSDRTGSLLGMLSYMLSSGNSPGYVSANSARLKDAVITHNSAFQDVDFKLDMQAMTSVAADPRPVPAWLKQEISKMPYHSVIEMVEFFDDPSHVQQINEVIGQQLAYDHPCVSVTADPQLGSYHDEDS